jgi:hypothetical protein
LMHAFCFRFLSPDSPDSLDANAGLGEERWISEGGCKIQESGEEAERGAKGGGERFGGIKYL